MFSYQLNKTGNAMLLRIAHRINHRTTIQCDRLGESYFVLDRMFECTYLDDEKALIIQPSTTGRGARCSESGGTYSRADMTRIISFKCLPDWLPAFQVNEPDWEAIDDMLIWRRPPVWALPWTKAAPRGNARAVAQEGLDVRLASARRNLIPLPEVIAKVPNWARNCIGVDAWCKTVASHAEI